MSKLKLLGYGALLVLISCSKSQSVWEDLSKIAGSRGLSETQMANGLKEALQKGISEGTQLLGSPDGFLKREAVKIMLPSEFARVENSLRSIGMNTLLDELVVSLNRAAEDAVNEAQPIFTRAIRDMRIEDAKSILLGNSFAATEYFRNGTSAELTRAYTPIIQKHLSRYRADQLWAQVINRYNKIPTVDPIEADLTAHVAQKGIDGTFYMVGQQEKKIRENIEARSTELLQKVFAFADAKKGSNAALPAAP